MMAETNVDLQDALEFYAFVSGFKEKHDEWTTHGDLLNKVLDRLYNTPGCQNHFAQFDDSLAYLSSDIIHDVAEAIAEPNQQHILAEFVHGPWGDVVKKQITFLDGFAPQFGDTSIADGINGMYESRWRKFIQKAPLLHGKLQLSGLCGGFLGTGEALYSALKPHFHDLSMHYHINEERTKDDHLRAFLVKQLQSPCLRKLHLCANVDLGLDSELSKFCLSDRFEFLHWDCPMPVEFFLRIYEAFNTCVPVCKTRQVKGVFERSALKELVETLQLERSRIYCGYDWSNEYKREERSLCDDCVVSISAIPEVLNDELTARVNVTVQLTCVDSNAVSLNNPETRDSPWKKVDETVLDDLEVDKSSVLYDYWNEDDREPPYSHCKFECKLETHIDRYDWTADDCENCAGCEQCRISNSRYDDFSDYDY